MDKSKKKMVSALCIIAIAISFYIGGVIGFDKGYRASKYLEGADAFYTVMILERVRDDQKDDAILLLETKLDSQIFNLGFFEQNKDSIFSPTTFTMLDKTERSLKNLMRRVIAYRNKYPSKSENDETLKIINKTLRKYGE